VTKLNANGSAAMYSSRLGGRGDDRGTGIAIDSAGNAFVTGFTTSVNFPTASSSQPESGNAPGVLTNDAFVAKLNADGNGVLYSTYLGGSGNDQGTAIAVNGAGAAYVAGLTASADFPLANPPAFGSDSGGGNDAFIAKFVDDDLNHPPILAHIGDRSTSTGSTLTFTAVATDPDSPAQSLTYSLDPGAPAGATIDPMTGVFTWPASALFASSTVVTVRVTDSFNPSKSDFETVTLYVESGGSPSAGAGLQFDGTDDVVALPHQALHSQTDVTTTFWLADQLAVGKRLSHQ
jgi:hypothetical protein